MTPAAKAKGSTKKAQTPVTIKNGNATVFVHKSIGSISIHGQTIDRGEVPQGSRTWSFECPPEVAREFIERYEFAAGSEAGVPLTVDEQSEVADLKSRSGIEVGRMSSALAELAAERVRQQDETKS